MNQMTATAVSDLLKMLYQKKNTHTKIRLRECKSKLPDHGTEVFNWNQIQEQNVFFRVSQVCWAVWQFIFFSVREQAVFYKSCNLIGSESGQYSSHPARSQQVVSEKMFQSFLGSLLNHFLISLLLSFICIAPVFSTVYLLTNCSVYGESCPNYSPLSFRFFRKKIKMLFTSQGQSVLGKTVPSVLCTKTSGTVFPDTDWPWLVNNIYNFWTIEVS